MTELDVARGRLHSQHIAQPTFDTPEAVVRWMGAMQAQDYGQALWAIGVRMPSVTLSQIEAAIADGRLIRTWTQRGTIHFAPPEDAHWMIDLTAKRMIARDAGRLKQLELDADTLLRAEKILCVALETGRPVTRNALMKRLELEGISTSGQRGYHILWHLAQHGLICLGPLDGKQQTFVLYEKWVKNPRQIDRNDALVELARRYFTSHAPATVQDFVWWTGLTMTDAKAALEGAKPHMVSTLYDGKTYWLPADFSFTLESDLHLLAGFDEYLLGYTDRSAVLDPVHAHKVVPGGNGVFFPMIVVGGQIVGTWKRTVKKDRVSITHDLFTAFEASEAFEIAAQRYGAFLELSVTIE
ncbi:MAG: winged helix DNA-binding domain-containing protein [Anaerolineae bacterium]|nr:winged helix DNA-binding domain-containing protein [Anaerolineae bacterium]